MSASHAESPRLGDRRDRARCGICGESRPGFFDDASLYDQRLGFHFVCHRCVEEGIGGSQSIAARESRWQRRWMAARRGPRSLRVARSLMAEDVLADLDWAPVRSAALGREPRSAAWSRGPVAPCYGPLAGCKAGGFMVEHTRDWRPGGEMGGSVPTYEASFLFLGPLEGPTTRVCVLLSTPRHNPHGWLSMREAQEAVESLLSGLSLSTDLMFKHPVGHGVPPSPEGPEGWLPVRFIQAAMRQLGSSVRRSADGAGGFGEAESCRQIEMPLA